jgi:hypothetical protein
VERHILVVGYPKSGNTWITRLTAELLVAPVVGFWNELHRPEIAVEGLRRISDFAVYKGHHAFGEVRNAFDPRDVVYVVRDVRDIAVSGAHYFSFRPKSKTGRIVHRLQALTKPTRQRSSGCENLGVMIRALSDGDPAVSPWCSRPWDEHLREYLDARVFFVRYEDALSTPERTCQRILAHLGVDRPLFHIRAAIEAQRFETAKRRFLAQGEFDRAAFLREGRSGSWLASLTHEQRRFCEARFGHTLSRLGYSVTDRVALPC